MLEEVDHFGQLELDLVDTRDIFERGALIVGLIALGARLAHTKDAAAAASATGGSPEKPDEQQDEQDGRAEPGEQRLPERPGLVQRLGRIEHILGFETLLQVIVDHIARPYGPEAFRVLLAIDVGDLVAGVARDPVAERADPHNVAAVDLLEELRIRDRDPVGLVRRDDLEHDPVERQGGDQNPPEPRPSQRFAPTGAAARFGRAALDAPAGRGILGPAGGFVPFGGVVIDHSGERTQL